MILYKRTPNLFYVAKDGGWELLGTAAEAPAWIPWWAAGKTIKRQGFWWEVVAVTADGLTHYIAAHEGKQDELQGERINSPAAEPELHSAA